MADTTLTAQRRDASSKRAAGRVRREGLVPGVLYGLEAESIALTVPARELSHILSSASGLNTLITLQIDGKGEMALARQLQRHPVKGTLLHVDFLRVRADQTIQAEVPIRLVGDAEGVARGGVLEQMIHTLAIEARPGDFPDEIEHDISAIEIGGGVHVRDLTIPSGVTVLRDADETVAQISAPRVAEEPTEGEAGEGAAGEGEGGASAPAEASSNE